MSEKTYTFRTVAGCEMCGSERSRTLGMRLDASQGSRPRAATGIAVSVKQCLDCGLIYADPQPIPQALSDHYGIPADEYWSPEAFDWSPAYFAAEIEAAKRLLPFADGMTALDIGAGLGKAMRSLAHAGFDTWGIEPSLPFFERAAEQVEPARLQLAAIEDAEFPEANFDFITFGAVLEHIYAPSSALRKALGWLKPGGIIQVEVPSSRHLISKIANAYFKLRGTSFVTHISPMHAPFHLYEFGLASFERNGHINGYEIADHSFQVCSIYHVPKILHGPLRWWMERTDTGMQLSVYLRKLDNPRPAHPPG